MSRREELLALAKRCEGATGPDRRLDGEIWCAIEGHHFVRVESVPALLATFLFYIRADGAEQDVDRWPAYTRSLDAALSLVPEGWWWEIGVSIMASPGKYQGSVVPDRGPWMTGDGDLERYGLAATPALALAAAALRARAAMEDRR